MTMNSIGSTSAKCSHKIHTVYPEGCTLGAKPPRRVVTLTDIEPLSVDPHPRIRVVCIPKALPCLGVSQPQTHTSSSSAVTGNSTQELSISKAELLTAACS